jgi:hypothetical protein
MADPLGTSVRAPSAKDVSRAITIGGTYTSGGATTVVTITIDPDYPAIDRSIQSPVLLLLCISDETALAVGDNAIHLPKDQMEVGVAPDSANEFLITGDRTIDFYNTPDKDGKFILSYIPKATGHQV